MKYLSVLGSTGSIGVNTLNVVRQHPEKFRIMGLSAGENITLLQSQILEFKPKFVSVATEKLAVKLAGLLTPLPDSSILFGSEGCQRVATIPEVNLVVSAIVGSTGLLPTLEAINHGKEIALANKETLVMAGKLVMNAAKVNRVRIIPVDSEHSAIYQCLRGNRRKDIRRIILTASGGPFLGMSTERMRHVTLEEALLHPRWIMGKKITIDSATMINKGLEILEARWLFNVDFDLIDVHIHPQSIVHSLVEYHDGSVLAQMGNPDMKLPIAYALAHPARMKALDSSMFLDLPKIGKLEFYKADISQYPALRMAYRAGRIGGTLPAVMNGANEKAVESFLQRRISFYEITDLIEKVMSRHSVISEPSLDEILAADRWAKEETELLMEERIDHC
jgi:1-deoxy-D-xylulose-5-phosphate reductoisomerase